MFSNKNICEMPKIKPLIQSIPPGMDKDQSVKVPGARAELNWNTSNLYEIRSINQVMTTKGKVRIGIWVPLIKCINAAVRMDARAAPISAMIQLYGPVKNRASARPVRAELYPNKPELTICSSAPPTFATNVPMTTDNKVMIPIKGEATKIATKIINPVIAFSIRTICDIPLKAAMINSNQLLSLKDFFSLSGKTASS